MIDKQSFVHDPQICQLDLRPIVERCHRLRQTSQSAKVCPELLRDASTYRLSSTAASIF